MEMQTIIASIILVSAGFYVGGIVLRKFRSFSPKAKCGNDFGCNGGTKNLTS